MVDKIDKPEPPPAYSITGTTETKRDKPREERGQEDLPTFQKETPSLYREKFQGEGSILKTILVPLDQIQKLIFRRATPRHGIPTVEADLIWKDGKTTEAATFLLHNWQDFLKIKNLKMGAVIPPEFWSFAPPNLEITIRQSHTSGPWNLREIQRQASSTPAPKLLPAWWQKKSLIRILYAVGLLAVVIAIVLFLRNL